MFLGIAAVLAVVAWRTGVRLKLPAIGAFAAGTLAGLLVLSAVGPQEGLGVGLSVWWLTS